MHFRNSAATLAARYQHNGAADPEQLGKTAGCVCGVTWTRAIKKKCVIWVLVLLQVCLVGCFWKLQIVSNVTKHNEIPRRHDIGGRPQVLLGQRIDFITKKTSPQPITFKMENLEAEDRYAGYLMKNFILNKIILINGTDDDGNDVRLFGNGRRTLLRWCFREGTFNITQMQRVKLDTATEKEMELAICQCQAEWHGKDCGQPEVIWRTLMTAKRSTRFHLQQPTTHSPHRIVYMLDGYFFNLDLMELQIKTVAKVVDFFVINISHRKAKRLRINAIEKRLKDILQAGQYIVSHCRRTATNDNTLSGICNPLKALSLLKQAIVQGRAAPTKPTDIFLYTNDLEILNRKAINFIKYYYNSSFTHEKMLAMQFRLKYVVYGFYWQHPKLTHISGVMSSFATLESPNGGNGDPSLLLNRVVVVAEVPSIVIGDLNHFGGWYCQHCQQPNEIIESLHAAQDATGRHNVQFPNASRNRQIDVSFVQKLIAQGKQINDSKLELVKLRRYTDKYYAPSYTEQCSWKFGHLLANLYVSLEEDMEDEEDAYF